MQLHDVLIRPVITEKSTMLMEEGKYTFRVPLTANKVQIRQAVEKIFNVKVEKVATIRVLGKTKRMGRTQGKRSDYKSYRYFESWRIHWNSLKVSKSLVVRRPTNGN